jgi:hypothetical protein
MRWPLQLELERVRGVTKLEPWFYWVRLGGNPTEVAPLDPEQWWLCGSSQPWPGEAPEVLSARFELPKPRLQVVPPDEPA